MISTKDGLHFTNDTKMENDWDYQKYAEMTIKERYMEYKKEMKLWLENQDSLIALSHSRKIDMLKSLGIK